MTRWLPVVARMLVLVALVVFGVRGIDWASLPPEEVFWRGLLLGCIVLAVAALVVFDALETHYSTDAGEREADRCAGHLWPDDQDFDPEDCR